MIGLDTNVIVRYLAQDDPEQSARATELIDGLTTADPGFVSLVAVVETYWVLRSAYGQSRPRCAELIDGLLDARELRVGSDTIVRAAAGACRDDGADFADAVIAELGRVAGCEHTMTLDRRASRGGRMRLVEA
ncbi:PIN domain-containing protein [uncultured Jatrophihabitans sp.]|uniref:PIN domain-containing protein n=1 Tax=uncultured Jatrophihabitans sp. TaxID=1610747 RepID=UPI0035CB855F